MEPGARGFMDECYEALEQAGQCIDRIAEPCRSALIVRGAMAIFHNGGCQYFFEGDFPDKPDYAMIVEAFRRVGLTGIADDLVGLVALFPFEAPHLHVEKRMALLDDPSPDFDTARARLDDRVFAIDCDQVDQVLDEYILRTRAR
ncbi:DMP19 family protein [Massilia timonae]|uniref:DMP19 family protein n=1 Tax=Massilia timonae TaxID=47229 RepID=UPI0028D3D734|nr:hypothetical protein [Massilia timonae]